MIHYFNPGHETAVLNSSKYYMPPANVVAMQRELAYLPAWYAKENDYVLVEDELSNTFLDFTKPWKLPLPVTKNDFVHLKDRLKYQQICFWGISPQAIHVFNNYNIEYQLNLEIPTYNEEYKKLISRQTAKECLDIIIKKTDEFSSLITPQFFTSLIDIEKYIEQHPSIQFIAKAPYSSSGRGLLWLPKKELTRTEKQILHGHLKKQGSVSLERVLNKQLDFAMEFYSDNKNIRFEGYSLFQTNSKGAYTGNLLGTQKLIQNKITQYISLSLLEKVKNLLTLFLKENISPIYSGCIGVDMMVYEDNENFLLQPCLEINLRNNMGFLALELSKNIVSEQVTGFFNIDFNVKKGEIYSKHIEMQKLHPVYLEGNKIKSGYLSLCPIDENSKYRAYVLVG